MPKVSHQWLVNSIKEIKKEKDDHELTPQELQEIKDRAFSEYEHRMDDLRLQSLAHRKQRKGLLRRVVTIAAATVSLFIISFAYSVLAPVSVSNADNLVRRAAIWVNDKLKLGFQFSVPFDNDNKPISLDNATYYSIEEAANNVNVPFAYFADPGRLAFNNITVETVASGNTIVVVSYKGTLGTTSLQSLPLGSENTVSFSSQGYEIDESEVGTIYSISTDKGSKAYLTYNGYLISVSSDQSQDALRTMMKSLILLN